MSSKITEIKWQEVKFVLYADKKRHLKLGESKHGNCIVYYLYISLYEADITFLIINNVTFTLKIITDGELLKIHIQMKLRNRFLES